MGKPVDPQDGHVETVDLKSALEERYLAYALSTITDRALPDVRDGLKPVHRRVLYAMRLLRLDPGTGYKKCATVVGEVIGKLPPARRPGRSTTPWCAWPRTSPSAIRWSTGRGISAISTAITPRPCATPRRG